MPHTPVSQCSQCSESVSESVMLSDFWDFVSDEVTNSIRTDLSIQNHSMTKVEPGTAIVISAVLYASLMPFFGTRTGKSEIRLRQPIKGSKHNSANTWIHPIAPAKRKRANLPIQISLSWKITTKASYAGSILAIYKCNKRIVNDENQKHVSHFYIL